MSRRVAWLLTFSDLDPGAPVKVGRWWSGEGQLTFETLVYDGAMGPNGSLLEVGDVEQTADQAGRRATLRLAVPAPAVRHALSRDLGSVAAEIGWIWSADGVTWTRIPRRYKGRLSETRIVDGVLSATIATYWDEMDRGRPLYWSDATQRARAPADPTANPPVVADAAFADAAGAVGNRDLRWGKPVVV